MYELGLIVIGVLLLPGLYLLSGIVWTTRVALHDAADLWRTGELKPGYSRANWLWIVPRAFYKSWVSTARNALNGAKRVL